jgi:hypothetical protein
MNYLRDMNLIENVNSAAKLSHEGRELLLRLKQEYL